MKKLLLSILFLCSSAFAAEPINLTMSVLPGGNVDIFARAFSKHLSDSGVENIVVYHAGANGDIAYNQTMTKPDNSIFIGAMHAFVLSHVSQNRENFYTKNMKIYAPMVETPFAFMSSSRGFSSFDEMIKFAKSNELACGVSNAMTVELFRINKEYKTKFQPIPYKGTSQIKTDLLGNHIKCAYDGAGAYAQEHELKQLKYLASNMDVIKDVPHISSTLQDYKFQMWFGVAIANDSKLLKNEKLMTAMTTLSANKEYVEKLSQHNLYVARSSILIDERIDKAVKQYKDLQ